MPVPFIPAPNCARVQMVFTLDQQRVMMVFNVQHTVPLTLVLRTNLNTAFHQFWTGGLKAQCPPTLALVEITTTNLDAANSPSTTEIVSPPEVGTGGGNALPGGSALVITHRTALRGRNYRGRSYMPGISNSHQVTPNVLGAGSITVFVNAFFALIAAVQAVGPVWVVLSKYLNKVPRGQALATPVTAVSADQFLDSQRRRLTGRGT